MNTKLLSIILLAATAYFAACKKDKGTSQPPPPSTFKKPGSILYNWEYNGATWVRNGFMLLDLDHASNKDKSYITIQANQPSPGEFKFTLKKAPLPIDSLATNWPADVRSVSFGYSNDMTVNAAMRLQAQSPTKPYTYRYDSIHKFSSGIYMYNYLQNPLYAGSMAGKTPQGREGAWGADANNNAIPHDIIYYFKESSYSNVIGPGNGGKLLTEYSNGLGAPSDTWQKVDACLTIEGYYYTHLYFDLDEWQYFSLRDWCPSVYGNKCDQGGLQVIQWKSMNTLMTWPAGWGKQ